MTAAATTITPMMAQYLSIKEGYGDALLFYRMGDFYELFFDDAVQAAAALDIALTKRGKHLGKDIAMCGVPAHSAEAYLLTLIRKGFRVAVCEQMESPAEAKKRGSKSVVRRDVVRLVTPGTLTEDTLLDARKNNYLAAFVQTRDEASLAWADMSTGEFRVAPCPLVGLSPQLARLSPKELLISEKAYSDIAEIAADFPIALTPVAGSGFDSKNAEQRLTSLFGTASLESFGSFSRADIAALGGLVNYLDLTQKGNLPLLRPPVAELARDVMAIDAATRRNLELTSALSGGRAGSLLAVMDRTVTGAGARLLTRRLTSPLVDKAMLDERLDSVAWASEHHELRQKLRATLKQVPDIDRALSRLSLDRGGPRDIGAIRAGITAAEEIASVLSGVDLPSEMSAAAKALNGFDALRDLLAAALRDDLPLLTRDGGFVAKGYRDDLDEARKLRDDGKAVVAGLQKDYADLSKVNALKIKHNNVLGYFIETPATHADKMLASPLSETFIHRQTTANAVRFTTVELSSLETRILNAGSQALELEREVFEDLRVAVLSMAANLGAAAQALAVLDVTLSLADLAVDRRWCRPVLTADRAFEITDGRHPVVEQALAEGGAAGFVPNSCDLTPNIDNAAAIWVLTGPNMAGKSTFLRQNALIAILAQMGSFVPAKAARIGLVSQLFSRVGASDDLARGRSTFMVEMVETAAILNQAADRALVILDEIGRGTATYDGLSIAWATLEHLHENNRCRTLFATHYHELTSLSSSMTGIENATVAVREWEGDVIFLHDVIKGAADRSYGVQVARLAGLPTAVVERAKLILEKLEKAERGASKTAALFDDLPLFSATPPPASSPKGPSPVEVRLTEILPDTLSPREALDLIYELRDLLNDQD